MVLRLIHLPEHVISDEFADIELISLRPDTSYRSMVIEMAFAHHLRHSNFVGLRDDNDPQLVVRET
jgi:hypothetical protein